MVLIEGAHRRLRIADFSPKTEMANTLAGEVETTRTTEKSATAGAQIGGGTLPPLYGLASASLGGTHHHVVAQTIKELPSKCLVLASGTMDSEHGVFFKIKGAPQVPLEGAKEFTCTFEVPKEWRGGWCLLSCHARGVTQRYMSKKIEPCGHAETLWGCTCAETSKGRKSPGGSITCNCPEAARNADRLGRSACPWPPSNPHRRRAVIGRSSFLPRCQPGANLPGLFEHRSGGEICRRRPGLCCLAAYARRTGQHGRSVIGSQPDPSGAK